MKFISTRGQAPAVSLSQAIEAGLAPDGGLYVPESFPQWNGRDTDASAILKPFFEGDALESHLTEICANAFNFPIPVKVVHAGGEKDDSSTKHMNNSHHQHAKQSTERSSSISVLELFHGPTAAFKDVGARFLAECQSHLSNSNRTVMVATSGDTGGAVAAAFFNRPNVNVIILFPKGMVSARQKQQLTCWGGNITAYEVRGTFDDCQRMVKEAFQNPRFTSRGLTSANSINVGRLLPQMTYYAKASAEHFQATGQKPGFIIPSGNLGNAVAALWAKKCGYPIGRIVMSTNANRAIEDYLETGKREPHATIATLANAMDVGNPSNLERAIDLYPDLHEFNRDVSAISVSDAEISATIAKWASLGEIWCPHTATAVSAWEQMQVKNEIYRVSEMKDGAGSDSQHNPRSGTDTIPSTSGARSVDQSHSNVSLPPHWIIVATAHPAKFETIVEPLIGKSVPVPETLSNLLSKASLCTEIDPDLDQVR